MVWIIRELDSFATDLGVDRYTWRYQLVQDLLSLSWGGRQRHLKHASPWLVRYYLFCAVRFVR
jgi:hypothetical protein